MKIHNYIYIFFITCGIILFGFALCKIRTTRPLIQRRLLLAAPSKRYPANHWKNKVASTCMNCGHADFICRHWFEDGLYCENCKIRHVNKLAKHYLYDEALTCMLCNHKNIIPKAHKGFSIKCNKCKNKYH